MNSFVRLGFQRGIVHLGKRLEERDLVEESDRRGRNLVPLVVQDIERLRGLHDEAVQVREHLLDPFLALVIERAAPRSCARQFPGFP